MKKIIHLGKLICALALLYGSAGCGRIGYDRDVIYRHARAHVDQFEVSPRVICPGDNVTIRYGATALETSVTAMPETMPEFSSVHYGVVHATEENRVVE